MTMDVSRLGIEVTSTGIDTATDGLKNLGKAAASTEKKIQKLTDTVSKLMQLNLSGTMNAWVGALGSANSATASLATSVLSIVNALNTQITALNNLAVASQKAATAQNNHAGSSGVFITTLKAMTSAAIAYQTLNLAESIVHAADEWTQLNTKMIAATGSQNNATIAMGQAYDIAQKLMQPLEGTIKLYSRLAPAMAQAGKDSETTREVVLGLASALRLGGANTQEANAAMLNFAHAMSAGQINAREFNSLAREAPLLLRALAGQLTGGNIHALKLLASQGKITMDEVVKAIQGAQPEWNRLISNMPITVEGALTRIKNTWVKSIGEMAQDTGFNSQMAAGLKVFEDSIPAIANGLGKAFSDVIVWVAKNKDELLDLWDQVKGLVSDIWEASRALASWVSETTAAETKMGALAAIVYGIRMVLAAFKDDVTVFKNAIVDVGFAIVQLVLWPILKLQEIIGEIIVGFSGFLKDLASGARSVGKNDFAKQLDGMAESTRGLGQAMIDDKQNIDEMFASLRKGAQDSTQAIMDGKGALDQLRNSMSAQGKADAAELSALEDATRMADRRHSHYDENYNQHPTPYVDPKALAAAERLTKEFDKQKENLIVQIDQGVALNTELDKYGQEYEKLGPMQKELIKYEDELAKKKTDGANSLALYRAQQLVDLANIAAMEERIADTTKQNLARDKTVLEGLTAQIKTAQDSLDTLEDKASNLGGTKGDRKASATSRAQNTLDIAKAGFTNLSPDATASDIQKVIDADTELLSIAKRAEAAQKIIDQSVITSEWNKLFDPKKAQAFGDSLTKAFGASGKALKTLVDGLKSYAEEQQRLAAAQKLVDESTGADKVQRQQELAQASAAAQIKLYGDMTEAAQGFFKKGTIGYQALGNAEKVFRAAELAQSIYNFVMKSGLLTAFTSLFATETATQVGIAAAGSAGVVATEVPKQAAYGVSALAAALTIPPPLSFVAFAATAAALLAIGVAIAGSGGSNGPSSAQRQATQGTGTVLGDSTQQSESISKSISDIEGNTTVANATSSAMLSSLKNIEAALTGVTNSLLTGGVDVNGSLFKTGNTSSLKTLGFGSSSSLQDSGVTFGPGQTVGSVQQNGLLGSSYEDVQKKHKAFGITYDTSNDRNTKTLDPATTAAFTSVINSMVTTVTQAATGLGLNAAQVAASLKNVSVSLGDISLKGLTGDQITKQLEAVFSAFGDKLVQAGLGSAVTKFQQSGEGLLETAVRVASGVDQADLELEKLGLTAIKFTDIINTSGDVATEIVRQTIMMKEGADGISNIISTMSGSADDLVKTYQSLLVVRLSLQQLGISSDVSADLIKAAGGLDTLASALDDYKKDFFTAAQQTAMASQALQQQFAALGLTMPNTKAQFVDLVNQLSAGGVSGQELALKVIDLASAFNDLDTAAQDNISTLTDNLTTAYNNQSSALTDLKTKMTDFATSLSAFKTSLITGDLSTQNAVEKYATLKAQFQDTEAKAQAGDQTAISNFQQVAQDFLKASQQVNASGSNYTIDFQTVLAATQSLQDYTNGQATVADQQLTALQAQVSQLITINTSVETVAEAITALQAALTAGLGTSAAGSSSNDKKTILPVVDGSHAGGLRSVPWDGYIAELHKDEQVLTASEAKSYNSGSSDSEMAAQVKALTAEVAGLRADAAKHAMGLAMAVVNSAEDNAKTVVDGHKAAASKAAYKEKAQPKIA